MAERQRMMRGIAVGAAVLAGALIGPGVVSAQEQKPAAEGQPAASQAPDAAKGPNAGRLSINAGVDWTSAYFFRGIKQETEDLILQPYGELGVKLIDQAGALRPSPSRAASGTAPDRPHGLGQRDRVGSEGLVRVRRLRPALGRPLRGSHHVRPLHGLREPQQRLRHRPGARLRRGLQRRQASRPLRAQPLFLSPSSSTARPTPAPTRASMPRSASPLATRSSPTPRTP